MAAIVDVKYFFIVLMLTFISCAKTMDVKGGAVVPEVTRPLFQKQADEAALELARMPVEELQAALGVNGRLAAVNSLRYREFFSPEAPSCAALLAYTGAVFKRISPADFGSDDFLFAQEHLLITSFLYGLLRPLDAIRPYRLEGAVRLPGRGGATVFDFWKPVLTDYFINRIKENGGVLVNLASDEMKNLFDWRRVTAETTVVTPEFMVRRGGKLKTVVMYAKMCRGEMTRYIIRSRIDDPDMLKSFEWEGFRFDASGSGDGRLLFCNEE